MSTLNMAFDGTVFVQRSITEARETLLLTAGLVILIIFLFLATLRATIIPALAIPVSIIATFAILWALDYSINTFTLLGLILAIGIVVDDAIIVLENAYRHQEELGKDPMTAAIDGTKEITTAVIATTIALVAVFSPLLFLTGATGRLFNEFGVAVGGSVLISGVVALTLTPMLSAKILRVSTSESRFHHVVQSVLGGITNGYVRLLAGSLRRPAFVIVGGALLTVSAVFLYRSLEQEFVPADDRGFFFTFVVAPEGATVQYTDEYLRQIEAIAHRTEGIKSSFAFVGFGGSPSSGFFGAILDDREERDRSAQDIINEVQPQFFFGVPGVFAFASNPPAFGGFLPPVQFVVRHRDFETLANGMDALVGRASTIPGLMNVDTDLRVTRPELVVSLDRDRAEDLGVPARDIAVTLQTMLGGRDVSRFTSDNKLYDVILRLDPAERATPSDITGLKVRGRDGALVPLDAVTRVEERSGPRQLNHHNRVRAFTMSAALAPGFTLGAALDSLSAAAAEVLPAGSTIDYAGESREFRDSGGALTFAFALALIFVFMVLAAQFESLLHPFTVLLAVPLAVTGALLALMARRFDAQRVQPGRHDPAHRARVQELDPARDLRQRPARDGNGSRGGDARGGTHPPAPHPHDVGGGGVRCAADRPGTRRRCGQPAPVRLRHHRRTGGVDAAHAVPRAGRVRGVRAAAPEPADAGPAAAVLTRLIGVGQSQNPRPFLWRGHDESQMADGGWRMAEPRTQPARWSGSAARARLRQDAAAQGATSPVVTLPEARRRCARVDPLAVEATERVHSAGWERTGSHGGSLRAALTGNLNYIRFSDPFFNFGTGSISLTRPRRHAGGVLRRPRHLGSSVN